MKMNAFRGILLSTGLSLSLLTIPVIAQTAGQDMHNAGHETKEATQDAAHGTAEGTKKAYRKTKRGTKRAAHATERGTKKAWHKTENFGDRVADKPETH